MTIDNHVHIGVDPMFYLAGHSPYALDLERLRQEAEGSRIDQWVVFPFVAYFALNQEAMRRMVVELGNVPGDVPYAIENRRLAGDLARLEPVESAKYRHFLIADPGRLATAQVREWEALEKSYPFHGIKIQATIIQSPITTLLTTARCMLDFAEERDLPFLIHSSIAPDDVWSQCSDILQVVESRPGLRFVLAHSCRFHKPSLDRVKELPNAWFDCSAHGIHCECAVRDFPVVARSEERFPSDYSSPSLVLRDLAEAYPGKLIWGSDAPFYSYEDDALQLRSSYRAEVAMLDALPDDKRTAVSCENTLAWLGH